MKNQITDKKIEDQPTTEKVLIPGQHLLAYVPVEIPAGVDIREFVTAYMYAAYRGKEHFRVNPDSFRVHFRVFVGPNEVAMTDNSQRVYIAGTQFWSEEDTYSIYNHDLDVTITAPHGFFINIDELKPAIQKLQNARKSVDLKSNVYGNYSDDDGLRLLITVVSTRYCIDFTLFESQDGTSVIFAGCNRRNSLGKINGDGLQRDDFLLSFECFMDLYHMWIYVKNLLGINFPKRTVFNIGDSTIEWSGIQGE